MLFTGDVMAAKIKFIDKFYLKTFLIGWGICCLVWSFMLFQFWWGNHDWGYLKSGVDISSGLFEVRYSQHLPTILLLDGHVLPFFTSFCAIGCLVLEAILVAAYLGLSKSFYRYLFFVLFIGLNPYIATLFYFLYLSFVFIFWSLVGVFLLFIAERSYKWYNVLGGGVLFFLILGSYPPNIALILVLFVAKRLFQYVDGNESLVKIIQKSVFFSIMLGIGYVGFHYAYVYILQNGFVNLDMYNIATKSFWGAIKALGGEAIGSVTQLFHQHSFLEFSYCFLLFLITFAAFVLCLSYEKNRFLLVLFLVAILLCSRFCFIVGADVSAGAFRMEYWSRLSLAIISLAVLLRSKSRIVANLLLIWAFLVAVLFVKTDFEIQKVRYFEFAANRKYQLRRIDEIVTQPLFKMKPKYISLSFGYPRFYPKYMKAENRSGDIAGISPIFDFDEVHQLFWEEKVSPVVIGAGIWGRDNVLRAQRDIATWKDRNYWQNNPKNMENIRYWLYTEAGYNKAYIDDKYIITIFDIDYFYKYRETVINHLDN